MDFELLIHLLIQPWNLVLSCFVFVAKQGYKLDILDKLYDKNFILTTK